jgi:hypothetical protein
MLPESPRAWRLQQFRWTKGFVECLLKLAPSVWTSPRLPLWQKVMVTLQLIQPLAFLVGCLSIVAGLPYIAGVAQPGPLLSAIAIGMACGGLLGPISLLALGARDQAGVLDKVLEGAAALFLSSGLLLSNARAGLEALVRRRSEFVRTPKARTADRSQQAKPCRCGVVELIAGCTLALFTMLEQPAAILPLALAVGGLVGFGAMQIAESRDTSSRTAKALGKVD